MNTEELYLSQIKEHKEFQNFLKRNTTNTYNDFVEILNEDIENSIRILEEDPKILKGDSEDRLTSQIISNLRALSYNATHDTVSGGHVDIHVTHKNGYKWLGEAKKHNGYDWLEKGYKQLTTRYLRGTSICRQGGMIIYIFNSNCKNVVETWKQKLIDESRPGFSIKECPLDPDFAFYTTETHASGLELSIRHKAVQLYFKPED